MYYIFIYSRSTEEQKRWPSISEAQKNMMGTPYPIGFAAAAPPLLSIFLQDCNIYVTTNAFVRFMEGRNEHIGMVLGIKVVEQSFTLRHSLFLRQNSVCWFSAQSSPESISIFRL